MKKSLLFVIMICLFTVQAQAMTVEEELTELKTDYQELKTKIENINNTILDKTYPTGSIYKTTTYSTAEQVNEALGGTWEAYGKGKTLVGADTDDTSFNEVNKTGGISVNTLNTSNLPAHTHSIPALSGTAASAGAHTHARGTMNVTGSFTIRSITGDYQVTAAVNVFSRTKVDWSGSHAKANYQSANPATYDAVSFNASSNWSGATSSAGAHTHSVTTTANTSGSQGSGTSFTNLQPYITVYIYKRVS